MVTPQSIVAIESPISHSQPPKIYFGSDGEVLPPGLIYFKEISQDETPLTPNHFGEEIYLYESFPQSPFFAFFDPVSLRVPVDSIGYTLGHLTMAEIVSQTESSISAAKTSVVASSSMFCPLTSPMSSSGILYGSSLMSTKCLDPLTPYSL